MIIILIAKVKILGNLIDGEENTGVVFDKPFLKALDVLFRHQVYLEIC